MHSEFMGRQLILSEEFERIWEGGDPFKILQAVEGNIYRQVKNRKTIQFRINGKSYFVKLHSGVGWGEIVKNLLLLRMPILGAENEWRAVNKLQELGIATLNSVAYGNRGWNPATRVSFIVTEELINTVSLEDFCQDWDLNPPGFPVKKMLIEKTAHIGRVLHHNGICHRDFYLCHFLLHKDAQGAIETPKLSLIDLHRALIKGKLGIRWIIKDIAGLYFSAMDIGLTRRDLLRFIKCYDQEELRHSLTIRRDFWLAVENRALAMYVKHGPSS